MADRETNGSVAGAAIFALLTKNPDGLTRKELEAKGATSIPRNKAGFYIREGVDFLNREEPVVERDGKIYRLVSA